MNYSILVLKNPAAISKKAKCFLKIWEHQYTREPKVFPNAKNLMAG